MLLLSMKVENKDAAIAQHKEVLKALTAYVKTEYPGVTTGDLLLAYRLGVKCKLPGKDGEPLEMFAELNPRSIGKVLHAYEEFKREQLTLNPAPTKSTAGLLPEYVPSQQQQDRANAQLVRFAYLAQQQGRDYNDHGNLLYNWLDSKGLIPFNRERKWEFMKQAQERIRAEEAGHGATGNMQEHKDARALAGLLKQATEQGQLYLPQKDRITTKAKQIAFIELLKDMIEFDQTPDELLNSILTDDQTQEQEP
ncbi:hypothetical protein [Spirosoma aerolatum]|uniref:hypothetical protein n=1 Tax=Spirosoma aerolatum TaxID=1211326 RepID=UPI0012D2A4AD|nr:hypothetical protein [Spirosoma aerolatum]